MPSPKDAFIKMASASRESYGIRRRLKSRKPKASLRDVFCVMFKGLCYWKDAFTEDAFAEKLKAKGKG
jgi:hypothetical protein